MSMLWQDMRYGLRMLGKSPGFTAVAVLTLALGIGATTAIVSVVKVAVFDPLPVSHPDRLLQLGHTDKERGWSWGIFLSALREVQQRSDLFTQVAAYHWDALTLPGEEFPEPVEGVWVTPGFFRLWQVRPQLGRTFSPDEGQPSKDDVLVISYGLWKRQFGGDPAIIGRTVFFRERPMTVVGVMPAHFSFPDAHREYWRPVVEPDPTSGRYGPMLQAGPTLHVIATTQPGVAPAAVQAFLEVLTERQLQEQAPVWRSVSLQARGLREMFTTPQQGRLLSLLLGAVVFVLLIAAANVASLQSARAETRRQELATRAALGAGRARVFRQLLVESLLLAALGGVAGLAVSAVGLDLLQRLLPMNLPRLKPIALNLGVLGVAGGVTLLTGLLFGLAPAWRGGRANLTEVLKPGAAVVTWDRGRGRLNQGLIAGQFALALVLSAGAGLMVRTMIGLLQVNPGFDPKHVGIVYPSTVELQGRHWSPDPALNRATEVALAFFAEARRRVGGIPGVTAVGVQVGWTEMNASVGPGASPVVLRQYWVGIEEADPLRVLRVPLKQGRWLDRNDVGEGVRCVLVNETAARQLWPGEVALGKLFWTKQWNRDLTYEVVGVVGDTLDSGRHAGPQPTFYRALQKERGIEIGGSAKSLVFRAAVDPVTLYRPVGQALKAAGADPRMPSFYNLHEELCKGMAAQRALLLYLSVFAGVGLFLAALGLYGVLAYSVARRTREIGIRMALGAEIGAVMRPILRQGLALVTIGGGLGIVLALATGRLLRAYLFGVSSTDPLTFIVVALLLAGAALFACWLPARRAARIDPMLALRYE